LLTSFPFGEATRVALPAESDMPLVASLAPSGKSALEGRPVGRRSVRREHELNRQREQRAQSLDNLLPRHALG